MNWVKFSLPGVAFALIAAPAPAQMGIGGDDFVAAVRDRNGNKAMEVLRTRGTVALNSRDTKGETGLIVAVSRRDDDWTGFLLQQGADPNRPASNGDTPLIAASRVGYLAGAADLVRMNAKIDAENRMGETALIVAVQGRHVTIVKLLLAAGADPDKADSAAGLSARDYATRDTRTRELLKLIEEAKPKS